MKPFAVLITPRRAVRPVHSNIHMKKQNESVKGGSRKPAPVQPETASAETRGAESARAASAVQRRRIVDALAKMSAVEFEAVARELEAKPDEVAGESACGLARLRELIGELPVDDMGAAIADARKLDEVIDELEDRCAEQNRLPSTRSNFPLLRLRASEILKAQHRALLGAYDRLWVAVNPKRNDEMQKR